MPALTIPSPNTTRSASPTDTSAQSGRRNKEGSGSASPDRPPVSPISPTVSAAQLVPPQPSEPRKHAPPPVATFKPQPPPVSIAEDENPDAIALRSAISLLQLQREKSKRDLKTLQELKSAAISDPQGFARSLQAQRKQSSNTNADILTPTLSNITGGLSKDGGTTAGVGQPGNDRKDSANLDLPPSTNDSTSNFPEIPQPQNVIRCPPVNWAKYHIAGEPLDKMHEEQKQWPGSGEPPRTHQGLRAPPHAVAAPYSPFTDGISEAQTQQLPRGLKKSPS